MRVRDELTGGESWVGYFTKMDTGRYRQDLPAGRRRALRAVHCALFAAAAAAFFAAAAIPGELNFRRWAVIPESLAMLGLIRLAAALIHYLAAPREMRFAEHNRSSFALRRTAAFTAAALLASGVSAAVFAARQDAAGSAVAACALFSAAAAAMAAMYVIERRVRYIRLPDADGGEIN